MKGNSDATGVPHGRSLNAIVLAFLMGCLGIDSLVAQSNSTGLKLALSNGNARVSWPLPMYYHVLETRSNLSSLTWVELATAAKAASYRRTGGPLPLITNFASGQIIATLPAAMDQGYFQLGTTQMIPVFGFAVFYNSLLEFSFTSAWVVNGPVHANGEINTGANLPFSFTDTITSTQPISSPPRGGQASWPHLGTYLGNPQRITNALPLLPVTGTSDAHGLIDVPPAGVFPTNSMERSRLCNQAEVILQISNETVMVRLQTALEPGAVPGNDPVPVVLVSSNASAALATNFPFLTLTNSFFDQRENKTVLAADIDLNKYSIWISTNSAVQSKVVAPAILYVADNRTTAASQFPAVRLRNGRVLPSNGGLGFTVATRNPLYVLGHYNCPDNAHLGTTNTSSAVPAALMSDALTFLSANWKDALGSGSYTVRDATDMTVNAAILTGNVPSTGAGTDTFSGGAAKLFRLLEDWLNTPGGWRTLTLNTSFVCLFSSNQATNQMRLAGNFNLPNNPYYDPPIRQYNFDARFRNQNGLPPGTPFVRSVVP